MIVIDTNVVSEALHPDGHPVVDVWFRGQQLSTLHLTAPNLAELRLGVAILPEGRRKLHLATSLRTFLDKHFGDRLLVYDRRAAEAYALLVSAARKAGQAVSVTDGQIAAIASVHGFRVATRDVRPFTACGVPVINPWEPGAASS